MNKIEPIRPEEVRKPDIPDFVIEAFNELIQERWDRRRGHSIVYQEDAVERILKKAPKNEEKELERSEIFDKHYLDIEDIYGEYGWNVKYTKQPYNETTADHFFTFSMKKYEDEK